MGMALGKGRWEGKSGKGRVGREEWEGKSGKGGELDVDLEGWGEVGRAK